MTTIYLIIIIIILLILIVNSNNFKNNKNENFGNIGTPYYDGLSDAQIGWDTTANDELTLQGIIPTMRPPKQNLPKLNKKFPKLNKNFMPSQFNNNYRDVMTGIVMMSPDMKSIFNLEMLPVTTTDYDVYKSMPPEIVKLVYEFIKKLNDILVKMPNSIEIINDYNNYLPLTSSQYNYVKDKGIQQYYKDIGVNYNLYAETPVSSTVQFIKVINARREFTEQMTRYIVTFVIKKNLKSVSDQMQITVYFVLKNQPTEFTNINTSFSSPEKQSQNVSLEYVYTDGFYTNDFDVNLDCYNNAGQKVSSTDASDDNYYSFDGLKTSGITDDSLIIKETNKKLRERELAQNNFAKNLAYPIYADKSSELKLETKSLYPH